MAAIRPLIGPRDRRVELERATLFLDFDGTLAPIAARPEDVQPNPAVIALLHRARQALDGRLAIISGRSIAEIDRLTDGAVACIAGLHGLERRSAGGRLESCEIHPAIEDTAAVMEALARAREGLIVERKGASVALHYRLVPDAAASVQALAGRLAHSTGLTLQEGQMVVELKSPGPDKGDAVRIFMAEAPFRSGTPIYIGDDLTDEAAFLEASRLGGFGILVGETRPTSAALRLFSPPRVLEWLNNGLESGFFEGSAPG